MTCCRVLSLGCRRGGGEGCNPESRQVAPGSSSQHWGRWGMRHGAQTEARPPGGWAGQVSIQGDKASPAEGDWSEGSMVH